MSDKIVDACTIINLYGSQRPIDVLRAIGGMHVTPQVRKECLGIRAEDPENPGSLLSVQIDLSVAIEQRLLTQCDLSAYELESMVAYARELDDGEASSLAVAKVRGWKLATDDKKARRIATDEGIAIVSTAELMRHWAQTDRLPTAEIAKAVRAVTRYARFAPPANDPRADWWRQY
jgi:predicted nucleic acid-binding protein